VSIVIGEPDWKPWRSVLEPTGRLISKPGVVGDVAPEMYPKLRVPALWDRIHAY
jgi:hypothetical protein